MYESNIKPKISTILLFILSVSASTQLPEYLHIKLCDSILVGNIILYEDLYHYFQLIPSDTTYKTASYVTSIMYSNGVYYEITNKGANLCKLALDKYKTIREKGIT